MVGDQMLNHRSTRWIGSSMNQQVNVRMDAKKAFRKGPDNGNVDAAASGALDNA
jgi:hypothetical protein